MTVSINRLSIISGHAMKSWAFKRLQSNIAHQSSNKQGMKLVKDVDELLARPSWSVSSMLPTSGADETTTVTAKQLHHLLRLSALPPPKDEAEESAMLKTLSSQLHFVKAIQNVDTTDVQPLQSLRDETAAGREQAELGLDALKSALEQEEVIGQYHKRIRRKKGQTTQHEAWDVLGNAEKKVGRYFVVEGEKD